MVNVVVATKRNVHIKTNATAGIIDTTVPVTLKNVPTLISTGNSVSSLSHLSDVNASNPQNGDTLVYDESTGTYIVSPLELNEVNKGNQVLDCGSF